MCKHIVIMEVVMVIIQIYNCTPSAAGPAYYVLHPQKGITICVFLTYQAFKNREGIVSRKNLAEGLQIYVFLFHKIIYGQIH